jgi:hypothetical protein
MTVILGGPTDGHTRRVTSAAADGTAPVMVVPKRRCSPRSGRDRSVQPVREGIDSPAARFASAFAGDEGIKVERCRGPAVLALDQGLTQRAQLGLAVFE